MKRKIAIIGGGIGGLSAAYDLSRTQDLRDRYEVTVHQMGWRLGGKCATGRGVNGRIEEHGIHGFLGSYYNAIKMLRDVYADWGRPADHPLSTFEKAFIPHAQSFFWERIDGHLFKWIPDLEGIPGSGLTYDDVDDLNDLFVWLKQYAKVIMAIISRPQPEMRADKDFGGADIDAYRKDIGELVETLTAHAQTIRDDKSRLIEEQTEKLRDDVSFETSFKSAPFTLPEVKQRFDWERFRPFIDSDTPIPPGASDDDRRTLLWIEFLKITLRGLRDDNIEEKGFISIDKVNFEQWLDKHGASEALLKSPLVVSTINLSFQYPNGDLGQPPVMSASSYLQWVIRLLVYMKSPYLLFAAGTGETLITPLYQVLKDRGVKFEFFHALTDVAYDAQHARVVGLKMLKQAETIKNQPYEPLIQVKGLDAWPNAPLYDQLVSSDGLKTTDLEAPSEMPFGTPFNLQVGQDFDDVILAIPPAAIAASAPSLCLDQPLWNQAATKMPTVATQALQLWLKKSVADVSLLKNFFFLSGNFRSGFHGHVDFSKYLEFEDWETDTVKGLVYFCGVMKETDTLPGVGVRASANRDARLKAEAMLNSVGAELFPGAALQTRSPTANPDSLDYDVLHVFDESASGSDRLKDQYIRGNVLPSERYTQCPPGTQVDRINPLKPGISNMTGAGDWVDTGLNVGSVEGSVIGGLLAARRIYNPRAALKIIGMWPTTADAIARLI